MIPVNPGLAGTEILGLPVYGTFADIPARGHGRDLPQFRAAGPIVDERFGARIRCRR